MFKADEQQYVMSGNEDVEMADAEDDEDDEDAVADELGKMIFQPRLLS